jgi:hypothetical protein
MVAELKMASIAVFFISYFFLGKNKTFMEKLFEIDFQTIATVPVMHTQMMPNVAQTH